MLSDTTDTWAPRFIRDDGGRQAAGFIGHTGDCVVRAITIAGQADYQTVYDALNAATRPDRVRGKRSSSRTGVPMRVIHAYLLARGWAWVPTMTIGSGTRVHLKAEELPTGRIIARVSKHLCAVVNGTVYDTSDPTRDGTRAVYGFWHRIDDAATIAAWQAKA